MDTRDVQAARYKGKEGKGEDNGKGKGKKSAADLQEAAGKGKRGAAAVTVGTDQAADGKPKIKRTRQDGVELQQKLKALEACEACQTCQWSSAPTKGCRECLGQFYSQIRLTRFNLELYRRLSEALKEEKKRKGDSRGSTWSFTGA